MPDTVFRGTVCDMIGHRVDALADGNEKKAREYRRRLTERGVRMAQVIEDSKAMETANSILTMCKASFDPEQVKQATRMERWDTQFTCPDEFTIHVLVGPDGRKIGHRIVTGY